MYAALIVGSGAEPRSSRGRRDRTVAREWISHQASVQPTRTHCRGGTTTPSPRHKVNFRRRRRKDSQSPAVDVGTPTSRIMKLVES